MPTCSHDASFPTKTSMLQSFLCFTLLLETDQVLAHFSNSAQLWSHQTCDLLDGQAFYTPLHFSFFSNYRPSTPIKKLLTTCHDPPATDRTCRPPGTTNTGGRSIPTHAKRRQTSGFNWKALATRQVHLSLELASSACYSTMISATSATKYAKTTSSERSPSIAASPPPAPKPASLDSCFCSSKLTWSRPSTGSQISTRAANPHLRHIHCGLHKVSYTPPDRSASHTNFPPSTFGSLAHLLPHMQNPTRSLQGVYSYREAPWLHMRIHGLPGLALQDQAPPHAENRNFHHRHHCPLLRFRRAAHANPHQLRRRDERLHYRVQEPQPIACPAYRRRELCRSQSEARGRLGRCRGQAWRKQASEDGPVAAGPSRPRFACRCALEWIVPSASAVYMMDASLHLLGRNVKGAGTTLGSQRSSRAQSGGHIDFS